jgi:ATP-binding cassette, subfamily B, bacterial
MTNPIINLLKTEWEYLGKRKKTFILYISFFFIAGTVTLLTPYVLGTIFNSIQQTITSGAALNGLVFKILLLLVITLVFWLFHGVGRVMEVTTGYFVKKNYINDKIRVVLKLPVKWHKDMHSGDTIDKINRASTALEDFSSQMTFQIVYGFLNLFGSLVAIFILDWEMGLIALAFSVIVIIFIAVVDKDLNKKYLQLNNYNNALSAAIYDYIGNIFTVITLRLRKTVSEEIESKQMASYPTFKSSTRKNELKWGFTSIAIQVMIVIILIYRIYTSYYLTGIILIGTLYMFYGYLSNMGTAFYTFAYLYGDIVRANAKVEGAYPLDQEYKKLVKKTSSRLPSKWHEISLKNLSFTYDIEGKINHLENINLKFKRRQKIALVGESGSGKSTVLSLIRGLYDVETGTVYCDGLALPDGFDNIKDCVTLIPQEPEIFNSTFRYNITMNLKTTEEKLQKAISIAQLRPVLEKLPSGLDTNVTERGVSLSGGEKQRLALARGLLAGMKSDIILLDEPTSSVDSLNELKIHDNIFKEFRDKTIISSIHRLHLLDRFDYIYLFSKGKIVGQGTFNELKSNPHFANIWQRYNKEKVQDKKAKSDT